MNILRRYPLLVFFVLVALFSWAGVAPLVLVTGQPLLVGLIAFTPAPDRQLRVVADAGEYHPQPEWSCYQS